MWELQINMAGVHRVARWLVVEFGDKRPEMPHLPLCFGPSARRDGTKLLGLYLTVSQLPCLPRQLRSDGRDLIGT